VSRCGKLVLHLHDSSRIRIIYRWQEAVAYLEAGLLALGSGYDLNVFLAGRI